MRPLLPSFLLLGACNGPRIDEDPTEAVYDVDRLLRVEIEIDPDDWDALRGQSRDARLLVGEDCQDRPFEDPFTWFPASVTLDGQVFEPVGVRKKGFLGSLSEDKPALKIDLSEYGGTDRFSGVERLTLNNAVQDPSYVSQCLGMGVFADAGLPASRCSFAVVTVNGEELGVYVNIEPIKKPMLERHFGDGDGNLYEGTLSDFREGWIGTFEKKNNEAEDDWSDIAAVAGALSVPDDRLIGALEPLVDVDAFLTFWAVEVLTVHIDGYTWNTNNFYLYRDPASDRFAFLPWGNDASFTFSGADAETPDSVYAWARLPNRLYRHPEGRSLYLAHLERLLEDTWDEERVLARIDGMETAILPAMDPGQAAAAAQAIEDLRVVVLHRRTDLEEELKDGPIEWTEDPRESFCMLPRGTLEATFATDWGSLETPDPFQHGLGTLAVSLDGQSFAIPDAGAVAGFDGSDPLLFVIGWLSPTEALLAYLYAEEPLWAPGEVELDWERSIGALFYIDTVTMEDFELVAYVLGSAHFEAAGTDAGAPVEGSLQGELITWGM